MHKLPPHQFALLKALSAAEGARMDIEQLVEASELDQALITAAATEMEREGLLSVLEADYFELKLGELGASIARGEASLPERRLARILRDFHGKAGIKDLMNHPLVRQGAIEPGKYGRGLAELGWAEFDKGMFTLTPIAAGADPPPSPAELTLKALHEAGGALDVYEADSLVLAGAQAIRQRKEPTDSGRALIAELLSGKVVELREVNELTPEMLADGTWRAAQFRAYDVTLPAEQGIPGKAHPLMRLIEEVRLAFLSLGFEEASCPMAETAFWDFDALFQPQDHPARDMQDTFYCAYPARHELPDGATVARVRAAHEDGGETGSRGWRYAWSTERASQVVLRTHMTASSIIALARDPNPPRKVFSIGRVFRRENVDATHLPEFHQVDGIIIDGHASLASLLGTLRKFYELMGLPEVLLKPDFFPYTEPSVGVLARFRGKWLEMGGAGIFRPEVTQPLGCSVPVLAWGLGLERLAMARFGVPSIKYLVQPDLAWLRNVPVRS
jgi:phenylalanyl-tRNA synthetase alpha chain